MFAPWILSVWSRGLYGTKDRPVNSMPGDFVAKLIISYMWDFRAYRIIGRHGENRTEKAWDIFHLYFQFLVFRKLKESFTLDDDILDQRLVNAGIFDIEEADLEE